MNEFEVLDIVYDYRNHPDPAVAPMLFDWTRVSGILLDPRTALGWSGVVTGLYDRHIEQRQAWKATHGETLDRAFRVSRHFKSIDDPLWAEYLMFRWLILATDVEAWDMLLRAHHKHVDCAQPAQRCIERVMSGTTLMRSDGRPVLKANNEVIGSYRFADMRQQIIVLNEEFRKMTWTQRYLPFAMLPFSDEYKRRRRESNASLLHKQPVEGLIQ